MTVGVWGYGREGRAAVDWALRSTTEDVVVYDDHAAALGTDQARVRFTNDFAELTRCASCLISPGVPLVEPRRAELSRAGVELLTGTQLWMRDHHDRAIGVTGTKGKSTTSALLHHLLTRVGLDVELGGNIGVPLLELPDAPERRFVLELSSYQCQSLDRSPAIAVITQLAWDHVPAHGTVELYWRAKAKIFTERGQLLICAPDTFQSLREVGVATDDIEVLLVDALSDVPEDWPEVLRYPHNRANAALALAAAESLGLAREDLLRAATTFTPLEHRLQPVGTTRRGLVWVTDTLATTQESALAALNTFAHHPVTMIIGGQDRGQPVQALMHRAAQLPQVRLVCMGQSGARFAEAARVAAVADVHTVETLLQAAELATRISADNAVVLLSPAAPSYDQFHDYAAKSAALRAYVATLADR